MIGKGKSISHTKASIEYGWNQEKDAKIVFRNHLIGDNPIEIAQEFKNIQNLNYQCKKNTFSFVLSPTIEDGRKLKEVEFGTIANKFVEELKLVDHQAIAFIHQDKDHKHIHLYVNRINFSGKAYDDSYIGKKAQLTAEKVATSLSLTTVKQVKEKKLNDSKAIRTTLVLKNNQCISFYRPKSLEEYIVGMEKQGVLVTPTINSSNQLQGLTFTYTGHRFKGSEVHRDLSIGKLFLKLKMSNEDMKHLIKNETIILNGNPIKLHESVLKTLKKTYLEKQKGFSQKI